MHKQYYIGFKVMIARVIDNIFLIDYDKIVFPLLCSILHIVLYISIYSNKIIKLYTFNNT